MRCTTTKSLISAYIDNELNAMERSGLEQHLSACQDCGRALAEAHEVHRLFARAGTFEAPPGLLTRVRTTIREGQAVRPASRPFPYALRVAGLFAVAAILITGIVSGNILMKGVMPGQPERMGAVLALDMFEPTPPGTVGAAYLAMAEVDHEE